MKSTLPLLLVVGLPGLAQSPSPSPAQPAAPPQPIPPKTAEPFAFADFTWLNGNPRTKDAFTLTVGGGEITNPGRYLVLMPPINGATAASGTPYFSENPGD